VFFRRFGRRHVFAGRRRATLFALLLIHVCTRAARTRPALISSPTARQAPDRVQAGAANALAPASRKRAPPAVAIAQAAAPGGRALTALQALSCWTRRARSTRAAQPLASRRLLHGARLRLGAGGLLVSAAC
jgi:hypothetical protein